MLCWVLFLGKQLESLLKWGRRDSIASLQSLYLPNTMCAIRHYDEIVYASRENMGINVIHGKYVGKKRIQAGMGFVP